MNAEWERFLAARGALRRHETQAGGGFRGRAEEARRTLELGALVDLSHLGVVRFLGADAERFVHAQLTCDVTLLEPDESGFAAWLTPKGRVRMLGLLVRYHDGFELVLPAEQAAEVARQLRRFVLRAKLTITDVSGQRQRLGLVGPRAAEAARVLLDREAPAAGHVARAGELEVLALPPGLRAQPGRYTVAVMPGAAGRAWERAAAVIEAATRDAWGLSEVEAGVPSVRAASVDRFTPHMLSLDRLRAVSFDKGCYPGQEIVARTEYLGRTGRRLHHGAFESPTAPAELAPVFDPRSGQHCGELLAAYPCGAGRWVGLLVVGDQRPEIDVQARLGAADGPRLELERLPGR